MNHSWQKSEERNNHNMVFVNFIKQVFVVLTSLILSTTYFSKDFIDLIFGELAVGCTNPSVKVINSTHYSVLWIVLGVISVAESEQILHDTLGSLIVLELARQKFFGLVELFLVITAGLELLVSRVSQLIAGLLHCNIVFLKILDIRLVSLNLLVQIKHIFSNFFLLLLNLLGSINNLTSLGFELNKNVIIFFESLHHGFYFLFPNSLHSVSLHFDKVDELSLLHVLGESSKLLNFESGLLEFFTRLVRVCISNNSGCFLWKHGVRSLHLRHIKAFLHISVHLNLFLNVKLFLDIKHLLYNTTNMGSVKFFKLSEIILSDKAC